MLFIGFFRNLTKQHKHPVNPARPACPACPACPVAPADGTGVAPADGTGVAPADGTGVGSENRTGAVQKIVPGRFTQFNPGGLFNRGSKNKNETRNFNPVPLFTGGGFKVSRMKTPLFSLFSHMGKIAMIDFLRYVVYIDIYRHYEEGVGYGINSKNISKRSIASG